ncbi:hypothetical protein FISHEDRAFT_46119 [Fistulina hepatica ATCC 64428]|uniref:DUF1996 domain-containing protein n=1 Tax=Fistulina hepatica ATCC 64428 TaxID=1128425 RepID=A0A0D7A9D6_9AGAR|nr:hypothetical protein FISHEDRAFT_46119 [Fistulina hepatica ATCC 64428]
MALSSSWLTCHLLLCLLLWLRSIDGYWLMAANNFLTTAQRIDPIVNPGDISTHAHSVLGGSNFRFTTNTTYLRESSCTSIPITQDKSNYWFPHLYFQWQDSSFTSVNGSAVLYESFFSSVQIYNLSDESNATTAFPDGVRVLLDVETGDPTLRTLNASSFAQQAITFLCLGQGDNTKYNEIPKGKCKNGVRSQINFPSCWNAKDTDSEDHKSHVTWLSGGPDNGTCKDPDFPVTLPRIFVEVWWETQVFDVHRPRSLTPDQPFVFANGDPTGYGYHADFINGWEESVLQQAVEQCHCNPYGDVTCCVDQGIFEFQQTANCYITKSVNETTTGKLAKLPGNNPVQAPCYENYIDAETPAILGPVYVYNDTSATQTWPVHVVRAATTASVTQTAKGTCIWSGARRGRPGGVVECLTIITLAIYIFLVV